MNNLADRKSGLDGKIQKNLSPATQHGTITPSALAPERRTIILDGIIGSGKSTLLDALFRALTAAGYKVAVVPEPIAEWRKAGIFERFCKDPKRHAYEFQTFAFATRVLAMHRAVKNIPDADIVLC